MKTGNLLLEMNWSLHYDVIRNAKAAKLIGHGFSRPMF